MKVKLIAAVALSLAGTASLAVANTGTLLPLDQYQAGTESTNNTIVQNGGFENVTASVPNNWTPVGLAGEAPTVGAPAGPNVSVANGTRAAQWNGSGTTTEPNKYTQTIVLLPNTDYVISGYVWNFATAHPDDLAIGELRGTGGAFIQNFALQNNANGVNGGNGVFAYNTFNSGLNESAVIEVNFDQSGTLGGRPSLAAQLDNISITPAANFVAPSVVPEPATLAALGALAALGVRRVRRA
jgi:hypothetical protein